MLEHEKRVKNWVEILLNERTRLINIISKLPTVLKVYPSDANFILVRVVDANKIYNELVEKGIIVRNRNSVSLCAGCLRITVGTPEENDLLISEMAKIVL